MAQDRLRNDRFLCTVSVDGVGAGPLPGPFDRFAGGDTNASETKYSPGGMGAEVSLGGSTSVANITVGRNFVLGRDDSLMAGLRSACGRRQATVTLQPLDLDKNPFGTAEVFTGILQRVQGPQHDSTNQDAAMMELEINPGSLVASA